jgi:hypothetical protein
MRRSAVLCLLVGTLVSFATACSTGQQGSRDEAREPKVSYSVVSRQDVSALGATRIVYKVRVSDELTDTDLRLIAERLIDSETKANKVNAISFDFYLPDTDVDGVFTAGQAVWAPGGQWRDAHTVTAGDYSTHRLAEIKVGCALDEFRDSGVVAELCGSHPGNAVATIAPAETPARTEPTSTIRQEGPFTLTIEASPMRTDTIEVVGTTNLPNGALVRISAQRSNIQYGDPSLRGYDTTTSQWTTRSACLGWTILWFREA